MDEQVVTKTIRTQLTDAQMADLAREAAAKQQLITSMESDLAATTKARKADIARVQADFDALIKLAGEGCREEQMEVIERIELSRGVAVWLDPRTLEHLGERPLTDKEKGGPIGELCGPRIFLADGEEDAQEATDGAAAEAETDTAMPADSAESALAPSEETSDVGPPSALDWLVRGAVSDVNFRNALKRATFPELQKALAHPDAARTKSRITAIKGELRKRGRAVPPQPKPEPEVQHELDAREPGFVAPRLCEACGHVESVHGDSGLRGCMALACPCRAFRPALADPDPLHLGGYAPGERGDTNLAEQIDGGPGEVSDAAI